jgi:predicted RND superfamily exporter protein
MKQRGFSRLARLQVERPLVFVVLGLISALLSGLLATRLELRTRFEELLPRARPSVIELERLRASVPGNSHVFVVVEHATPQKQRSFGDELIRRIQQAHPAWLVACEDGVHQARAFLRPRAGMFVSLPELQRLLGDVEARFDWEVGQQTGANLDDEPPPALAWEDLQKRLGTEHAEPFPDGYFQARDGRALVVSIQTSLATGDVSGARTALAQLQKWAEELRSEPANAELSLSYAGDLVTGLAEYGAVLSDLLDVGALGLGLLILVLFLFFLRLRALLALGAALLVGLSWTFGITYLTLGHLNAATGFLVSIVAGNGINFGIIYVARVYEERLQGCELKEAIVTASLRTRRATLSAALVASAAYGSLAVSDFHAFRHFAIIGGAGMLVCWLAAFLYLPSLLLLTERGRPPRAPVAAQGERYAAPLVALVVRAPRACAVLGVTLATLGAVALVHYVRADPLEYDMRRMQNDLGSGSEMYRASKLAGEIMGATQDGAMVMLADTPEQTPLLVRALEARRDQSSSELKPFEAVHSVFDFVPKDQVEKLPLLLRLRERLSKAHRRGALSEADFAKLEPYLPPSDLAPWSAADLPEAVRRPFLDRAGVLGRLVLIEPTAGQSDADVRYLLRWAESFREVPLPDGHVVRGSGRAVIFADILQTVMRDIPRTVACSLLMSLVVVLLTVRRAAALVLVLGALATGLCSVALAMWLLQIKINFFNFVALPISFGIGADYALNFVVRYQEELRRGGQQATLVVLRTTGGAILLCSLTTMLGYLALLGSVNQAIRSLGLLAVLGEVGCLAAAVLALPGYLVWREQLEARRTPGPAAGSAPI